jgi:hypothetical protein
VEIRARTSRTHGTHQQQNTAKRFKRNTHALVQANERTCSGDNLYHRRSMAADDRLSVHPCSRHMLYLRMPFLAHMGMAYRMAAKLMMNIQCPNCAAGVWYWFRAPQGDMLECRACGCRFMITGVDKYCHILVHNLPTIGTPDMAENLGISD